MKFFHHHLIQKYKLITAQYEMTEMEIQFPIDGLSEIGAIQEIPSNFKEPEGSSACSQEPSTGPYPEPVRSSPYHVILSL
jgi:hypothetical protein